jgi:DNA-binding NarL/FixJ family response regulator
MVFSGSKRARVVVVDDHELTRLTLKLLLQSQPEVELVGLASNGLEAIESVERYHPDVVILDLQMPIMDGFITATRIKAIAAGIRILGYSSVDDPQLQASLQASQIDAFCPKDISSQILIDLIKLLGTSQLNESIHTSIHNVAELLLLKGSQ